MQKHKVLSAGEQAPIFEAPNQNGETIELRSFYGKNLVLIFLIADNSSGDVMETEDLKKHFDDLQQMNYNVVGVTKNSVDQNKQFHDDMGLPFDLLADHDHNIMSKYGAWVEKEPRDEKYYDTHRITYLIDPEGTIAHVINPVDAKQPYEQIQKCLEGK